MKIETSEGRRRGGHEFPPEINWRFTVTDKGCRELRGLSLKHNNRIYSSYSGADPETGNRD